MTSNPGNALQHDGRHSKDSSSNIPLDRRTTSSTFSSGTHKTSIASDEAGESSKSASKKSSLTAGGLNIGLGNGDAAQMDHLTTHRPVKDGKGSYRNHRSKKSGGFLLSDTFEPPSDGPGHSTATTTGVLPRQRHSTHDHKGKAISRGLDKKKSTKRRSYTVPPGGSPLAANVTTTGTVNGIAGGNGVGGDAASDQGNGQLNKTAAKSATGGIDVDSAQIVNLALSLNESRRNATRRAASATLPPISSGLTESFVGGSLRQHLQQQRRVSRNVSPKPDRGDRSMAGSPRLAPNSRLNSPLTAVFDTNTEEPYQYHFSASTLARAEKAKKSMELMAQYRRLLQYVPPLKPQGLEKTYTASTSSTVLTSPTASSIDPANSVTGSTHSVRQLGRPYNPLQYIRNRKVRARNSRAIDGEGQGFGEVHRVSSWIDQVAHDMTVEELRSADCLPMPPFSAAAKQAASPHDSPQHSIGKSHGAPVKIRRPRIDWVTNPADMLADVYWLEQEDNKKYIEDTQGRRIFPRDSELKRPVSRMTDESEPRKSTSNPIKAEDMRLDLRIDTKLPEFKSIKAESETFTDNAASKARQKFREVRDAARIHHGHNGSRHHRHDSRHARIRSLSRSDSESSDSDGSGPPRKRSVTLDRGTDILDKQLREMLAREGKEIERTSQENDFRQSTESTENNKYASQDGLSGNESSGHGRSSSVVNMSKKESLRNGSSGRASLEVPGARPRQSLEGLDSTAPNSPQMQAASSTSAHLPSIGMDITPYSRHTSPTRTPISSAKPKIRPFSERNFETRQSRIFDDNVPPHSPSPKEYISASPETAEKRKRSISPIKKIKTRPTDERPAIKRSASIRKEKGEDWGIRGLFKARNPVSRVSDFLWKKDNTSGLGTPSGFSTDDSDLEDSRPTAETKRSRESSTSLPLEDADEMPRHTGTKLSSYLRDVPTLPTFTSPFGDRRGRSTRGHADGEAETVDHTRHQGKSGRNEPTIRVQNASPTPSPETDGANRDRDSSDTDTDSRRGSIPNGVQMADARLNSILGLPGKRRNVLPVTGLSNLETSHNRPSSMDRKRQWSISDRSPSEQRGPTTRREIARVRALLLSTGIKATEIARRAAEPKTMDDADHVYSGISSLAKEEIKPVSKSQQHRLAARIISDDVQLSSRMWQDSAEKFINESVPDLLNRITTLQTHIVENLTPMARSAADEADEVSKDLVTSQTLQVKMITDKMDKMMRRRRRRFRWLRRGGWVMVEWLLVGIMWYVWFMVVIARVIMGLLGGIAGGLRWLFWL